MRYVINHVAFLSGHLSEWARAYHEQQRARAHSHRQALRPLGAKRLKIVFVLQLAESYLTPTLFRQIVGRIERLAGHPT